MVEFQEPRGAALAAAARRYVEGGFAAQGKTASLVDVARFATRWSCDGWQAVARWAGLEFTPTLDVMQQALDKIGAEARRTRERA